MATQLQTRNAKALGAAVLVALLVTCLAAIYWWQVETQEAERVQSHTRLTAEQAGLRLGSFVAVRLQLASALRDALSSGSIVYRVDFQERAAQIQSHFDGIVALNWIDEDGVIRWITPVETNRAAEGRDLTEHPLAGPALAEARATGETRVTPPLELYQGGRGFAAYLPIVRDGQTEGFLNAVFRLSPLVETALAEGVCDDFCYQVHDGAQLVHEHEPPEEEVGHEPFIATVTVPIADRAWTLTLCPLPHQVAAGHGVADEIVMVLGLLLALALGLLTWLSLRGHFQLRERETQLRSIAEHVPGVIFTYESRPGQPRRLLYLGPGLETVIGPELAANVEVDFDRFWALIHPMDRPPLAREARAGESIGLTVDVELRVRTDSGEYCWVRALAQPLRVESEATRWHVVLIDITEQKQAEDDLRNTRARLEHLVAASPTVIYSRRPGRDTITFVSPNAAMLIGWDDDAFREAPDLWARLVHPEDREALVRDSLELLESGPCAIEYRLRHRDGHYVWIEDAARLVHDAAGDPVEIVGTWQDITERHRADERQKLMMNELDHRVKNNLASVQALADLTLATSGSLESFRLSFSGRIRAMARTHEALARHCWEGVRLADIMRLTLEPFAHGDDDRVSIAGADTLLPARIASPLGLACHELATNAAKYGALSSAEGRVEISWTVEDDRVCIDWLERDGPAVEAPAAHSFGLQLLEGLVERELGGVADVSFRPEGLACTMTLPLRGARLKKPEPLTARSVT